MRNDIYVKQFDSLDFDVEIKGDNCEDYELADNEKLWFCVEDGNGNKLIDIQQTDTHFEFAEITLALGSYKAEVGIILEDGKEQTLIQSRLFVTERLKEE